MGHSVTTIPTELWRAPNNSTNGPIVVVSKHNVISSSHNTMLVLMGPRLHTPQADLELSHQKYEQTDLG